MQSCFLWASFSPRMTERKQQDQRGDWPLNRQSLHRLPLLSVLVFVIASGIPVRAAWAGTRDASQSRICRPTLSPGPTIPLGKAGLFRWECSGETARGMGYFMVFVRPAGTYVLLKVPDGQSSYEFTPDAPGIWRWIVINTDPDRTLPDLESEQGHFRVTEPEEKQ